ncbi:hypothetical protein RI367_002159 [Sorochytrium milnesiophthora]
MADIRLRYGVENKALRTLSKVLFALSLLVVLAAIVFANVYLFSPSIAASVDRALHPGRAAPGSNSTTGGGSSTPAVQIAPTGINILHASKLSSPYFGASLDWVNDSPAQFNKRLGKPAAAFVYFSEVHDDGIQNLTDLQTVVNMVGRTDAVLALTLKPTSLDIVTDKAVSQIARTVTFINQLGVVVLLRWAHEMNGNWFAYGQKPVQYAQVFQKVATAIKAATDKTMMVWAPNTPDGYPYDTTQLPPATSSEFKAMDTNGDGQITEADDPLTPYFPGEQYVDWIGYSTFHFGKNLNSNSPVAAGEFSGTITVQTSTAKTWDVHQMFSVKYNKPFAIFETGSAWYPKETASGGITELQVKQGWWQQVFSANTASAFPELKLVCWFEEIKNEPIATNGPNFYRDFTVTSKSEILNAFKQDVTSKVLFGDTPLLA